MKTLKYDTIEIVHDRKRTVREWRRRVAQAKARRAAVLWGYMTTLFALAGMLMLFLGACIIDSTGDCRKGAVIMVAALMVLALTSVIKSATEDYGE